MATWEGIECDPLKGELKPHQFWYAIKSSLDQVYNFPEQLPCNYYGISIGINAPVGTNINLAGIIKPLVDGIISAFHYHLGPDITEVAGRVARKLNTEENVAFHMLHNQEKAILGARNLIHPFKQGFQWNPADDAFMQVDVAINPNRESNGWSLDGQVYALERLF